MPWGKYLSEQKKGKILAYKEENVLIRKLARRLQRSDKVVRNFRKDIVNYGFNKRGRPKKKLFKEENMMFCANSAVESGFQSSLHEFAFFHFL